MNHRKTIGAAGSILAMVVALASVRPLKPRRKAASAATPSCTTPSSWRSRRPRPTRRSSVMQGELEGAIFNDERKGFLDKALYQVHWVGDGTGYSYCFKTFTVKDGDKVFARCESKGIVNGAEEGTVTLIGGTGRYNGIKGKGTYRFSDIAGKVHWIWSSSTTKRPESTTVEENRNARGRSMATNRAVGDTRHRREHVAGHLAGRGAAEESDLLRSPRRVE